MGPDSDFLWKLWGKYLPPEGRGDPGVSYHPAVFHMFDVGSVAEALLTDHAARFAGLLGVPVDVAAPWVAFLVAAHDIGKLHPGFQQKVDDPERLGVLAASGLPTFSKPVGRFDHGLQSVVALKRWLKPRLPRASSVAGPLAAAVAPTMAGSNPHSKRGNIGTIMGGTTTGDGRRSRMRARMAPRQLAPWAPSMPTLPMRRCWSWPWRVSRACAIGSAPRRRTSRRPAILSDSRLTPDTPAPERLRPSGGGGFLVAERLREAFTGDESGPFASFARLFPMITRIRPVQSSVMELIGRCGPGPGLLVVERRWGRARPRPRSGSRRPHSRPRVAAFTWRCPPRPRVTPWPRGSGRPSRPWAKDARNPPYTWPTLLRRCSRSGSRPTCRMTMVGPRRSTPRVGSSRGSGLSGRPTPWGPSTRQ